MTVILRQDDVCARIGVSGTTLYRWTRSNLFPRPIRLGANSVGWLEADVEAWIDAKKNASGGL